MTKKTIVWIEEGTGIVESWNPDVRTIWVAPDGREFDDLLPPTIFKELVNRPSFMGVIHGCKELWAALERTDEPPESLELRVDEKDLIAFLDKKYPKGGAKL